MESVSSSEESDDSGKATGVDEEEGSERAGPPSTVHSQLIQRKGLLESRHRRLQARHNSIQVCILIYYKPTVHILQPSACPLLPAAIFPVPDIVKQNSISDFKQEL